MGQRHAPATLYPQERPGTHFTRGWVDLRAGLEGAGNLVPTGIRFPDRLACSQSLYRLSYPAHSQLNLHIKMESVCSENCMKPTHT